MSREEAPPTAGRRRWPLPAALLLAGALVVYYTVDRSPTLGRRPEVLTESAPKGAQAVNGDRVLEFTNFVRVQVPDGEGFSSTEEFFYEGWLIEAPTTRWTLEGPGRSIVMNDNDGVGNGELCFDGHIIEGNQFRVDRQWRVHVLEGASRAPALEELREL